MSLDRELEAGSGTLSELCPLLGLVMEAVPGHYCDQLWAPSLGSCPGLPLATSTDHQLVGGGQRPAIDRPGCVAKWGAAGASGLLSVLLSSYL